MELPNTTCRLRDDVLLIEIPPEADQTWISRLENKYPGFKIKWIPLRWTPDKGAEHLPPEAWDGVTMACLFLPHAAPLMSNVKFLQLTSAGVDKWVGHETYQNPNVDVCTASGIHAPQIAEWVMGTWLMMRHKYLDFAAYQAQSKNAQSLISNADGIGGSRDSSGMRMGILGYGAIGRQCACLAKAFGMEVYAYTRTRRETPESRVDDSWNLPGMGDPQGLIPRKWFHGLSKTAINNFLDQGLDVLVLSLPLTTQTEGIIGKEQFEILAKKRTFISNVARGKHLDTSALQKALEEGKIRGAALDVTDPEPLPDGHPLYTAPNVFVTPHVSWKSPSYWDRILDITEKNLERRNNGKIPLNLVDKVHHY